MVAVLTSQSICHKPCLLAIEGTGRCDHITEFFATDNKTKRYYLFIVKILKKYTYSGVYYRLINVFALFSDRIRYHNL